MCWSSPFSAQVPGRPAVRDAEVVLEATAFRDEVAALLRTPPPAFASSLSSAVEVQSVAGVKVRGVAGAQLSVDTDDCKLGPLL